MTEANQEAIVSNPSSTARREAIRAELEATRMAYHALLSPISDAAWKQQSAASRRNLAQVLVHIIAYLDKMVPMAVNNARGGKNMPDLPGPIAHTFNYLISIVMARGVTLHSARQKYDAAHATTLQILADIKDDEWELKTKIPSGPLTIEQIFRHHATHFSEHAAEVKQTLGQ